MLYKKASRWVLRLLYAASVVALGIAVAAVTCQATWQGKAVAAAGYAAALTGLVQLEVSGFFDRLITIYSDETTYPYGPPSRVTREVIDNPDRPIRTWLRNWFERDPRTGFWIVVAANVLQLAGTLLG